MFLYQGYGVMSHPNDHSQCGESSWILDNLNPEKGIFCEIGAFDGVRSSNTILFESLGWLGILVEPNPVLAAQAQELRHCTTICCAAGSQDGFGSITIDLEDMGLSGMLVTPKGASRNIRVPCFTLRTILDWNFQRCDLLSIDTEGTELEVWNGLGHYRPHTVIIEYQTCDNPSNEQAIVERLKEDGYFPVHKTQYNLIMRYAGSH